MGLRADIVSAVQEAFDGDLSDAVISFTYYKIETATYDPTAGVSETKKAYKTRGVWGNCIKKNTRTVPIEDADYDITVVADELATAVKINDEIGHPDGDRYSIVDILTDPTNAIHTFRVAKQ